MFFKRGLEVASEFNVHDAAAKERLFGDTVLPSILYDETDAHVNVNNLSAGVRQLGRFTYFYTQTCRLASFPGVDTLIKRMEVHNLPKQMFIPLITRAWCRGVRLLMEWIQTSVERPLGQVTDWWLRFEFPEEKGEVAHFHSLIKTTDRVDDYFAMNEKLAKLLERVCSRRFHEVFEHVVDVVKREELMRQVLVLQEHTCGDHCRKSDGCCRFHFPFQPTAMDNMTFMSASPPSDLGRILDLAGLAHRDGAGSFVLTNKLRGVRYHSRRCAGDQRTAPYNEKIAEATRSHHNVAVIDEHFTLAYLCAYMATAQHRTLKKSAPTGPTVTVYGSSSLKKGHHVLTISETEMVHHLLEQPVIVSSFDFLNKNFGPREDRYCVKKNGVVPPLKDRKFYPRNRAREVSDGARRSYQRLRTSRYRADTIQVYEVRPPETYDLTIEQYYKFTSIGARTSKNVTVNTIANYMGHGLYDLRLHRVWISDHLFKSEHEDDKRASAGVLSRLGLSLSEFTDSNERREVYSSWLKVDPKKKVLVFKR